MRPTVPQSSSRRTIIVIHGKGAVRGIGHDGGGDLDTVSAAAVGAARARARGSRFADERDESGGGGKPAPAGLYAYAFLNYNEGLGPLLGFSDADIILPDFPINALPPSLRLRRLANAAQAEASVALGRLIPRLEALSHEARFGTGERPAAGLRLWLPAAANLLRRGMDARAAAPAGLAALILARTLDHLEAGSTETLDALAALRDKAEFMEATRRIAGAFAKYLASDLIDRLLSEKKEWTPERMALARELHAFEPSERLAEDSIRLYGHFGVYLMEIALRLERLSAFRLRFMADEELPLRQKIRTALVAARDAAGAIIALLAKADAGWPAEEMRLIFARAVADENPPATEVILRLSFEANHAPLKGVEIAARRTAGSGRWRDAAGDEISARTDAHGLVRFALDGPLEASRFTARVPPAPQELVFPDMDHPDEILIGSGGDEEAVEATAGLPDQGRAVCIAALESQFDAFVLRGNRIAILADHHPYAPEVLAALEARRAAGMIGEIHLHVKEGAAGKSGAEILHELLVAGGPAATPGLAALIAMARHLDLHLPDGPRVALGIALSKLIGSGHAKIEMAEELSRLRVESDLDEIMTRTGWDRIVAGYEAEIATSLSKTAETACRLLLGTPAAPLAIHCCVAPRTAWGKPIPKTAAVRDRLLGGETRYLFAYLYEFGLAVLRASGHEDLKLNELAVRFGGGGHPGAATLQLVRDADFWRVIRHRMRAAAYPLVLEKLGRLFAEWLGVPWRGIEFIAPEMDAATRAALEAERLVRIRYRLPDKSLRTIACVFGHPAIARKEIAAGISHWAAFLQGRAEYVFFLPKALNDVLLLNLSDADESLDLDALARMIGAPWDGGTRRAARATPRLHPELNRRRWQRGQADLKEILERTARHVAALVKGKAAVDLKALAG